MWSLRAWWLLGLGFAAACAAKESTSDEDDGGDSGASAGDAGNPAKAGNGVGGVAGTAGTGGATATGGQSGSSTSGHGGAAGTATGSAGTTPEGGAAPDLATGGTSGGADPAPLDDLPLCFPCEADTECDPALVCGAASGGSLCVPPQKVTECCFKTDDLEACVNASGWVPTPECNDEGCAGFPGSSSHLGPCVGPEEGFESCVDYCQALGATCDDEGGCVDTQLDWSEDDDCSSVAKAGGVSGSCEEARFEYLDGRRARCCCAFD